MKPKMFLNVCPVCRGEFEKNVAEEFSFLNSTDCTIGICKSCISLIAIGLAENREDVESSCVPRDWFLENFSEEVRDSLKRAQEEMYREKGQWG